MIELSVSQIIALCCSCFSLGLAISTLIWVIVLFKR